MKRETFISVLSALLGEADVALIIEARNLIWSRERTLKEERVQTFRAGEWIEYRTTLGKTTYGRIDHLNKLSVSVRWPHAERGSTLEIIPIDRVVGTVTEDWLRDRGILFPKENKDASD